MKVRYSVHRASEADATVGEWNMTDDDFFGMGQLVIGFLTDPDVIKMSLESDASGR